MTFPKRGDNMSGTMAKEKKPKKVETIPVSFRLPKPVLEALDSFREGFEFPPDRSQVIERAIRAYLKAQGHAVTGGD